MATPGLETFSSLAEPIGILVGTVISTAAVGVLAWRSGKRRRHDTWEDAEIDGARAPMSVGARILTAVEGNRVLLERIINDRAVERAIREERDRWRPS